MTTESRAAAGAPSRAALLAAFGAVYLIWGSTYLAIRVAVETLPPFLMAGTRFLVAGGILYAACRLRGAARPTPDHWRTAAVTGLFLLLMGNGGVTWAEQVVPSGLAALIVATVPLWLAVLSWREPDGRRPTRLEAGGIALGLAGVALLVLPGEGLVGGARVDPLRWLVLVGASLAWAWGSLYGRRAPRPASHLLGVAITMLAGGAWLTIAGLATGETGRLAAADVSADSVAALLYLVVFGSLVAFSAYIWLLQAATPAQVGTYAFVNPVVAVLLGWLLAGEAMTLRVLAATTIVVAGVALIVVRRPRRRTAGMPLSLVADRPPGRDARGPIAAGVRGPDVPDRDERPPALTEPGVCS